MRLVLPGMREISAVPVARLTLLEVFSGLEDSGRFDERLLRGLLSSATWSFGGVVFLPEMKPPAAPSTKVAAGKIQGFFIKDRFGKRCNPESR